MKRKIGTYCKYFCVGWLCLLMFAVNQIAHAKLKIYYMPTGTLGAKSLADGC